MDYRVTKLTTALLNADVATVKECVEDARRNRKVVSLKRAKVRSVKEYQPDNKEPTYVYDIGMKNNKNPWFFANNILVHNSCYFSAYEAFKPKIQAGEIDWSVENIIYLYDEIGKMVNDTFPSFMLETFNVPADYGKVIAAAREVVARSAIFIKKKRYAALVIDKEGIRQDIGGKSGKLKVTGLDLRRNDTIKPIQTFLKDVLMLLLEGNSENDIMEYMIAYKKEFVKTEPWTWGTASKANNLTNYRRRRDEELEMKLSGYTGTKGFTIPAQITGALNWNELRDIHHDNETLKITDGMKIIRCFALTTPDNPFREISYPVDELRLPQWFLDLPFDKEKMIAAAFDKKVENMLGFLGWDLSRLDLENENFENMYVYDDDDC